LISLKAVTLHIDSRYHYITSTCTTLRSTRLFQARCPSHVTSDRGTEFVSHFFRSLGTALDMKLHFTSGYHPEGDGQTERNNQTFGQYSESYCNYQQDNWSELLPLAEFAYNNTPSATTGITPFFANKGYHPNLAVHPERDLASAHTRDFVNRPQRATPTTRTTHCRCSTSIPNFR